MGTKSYPSSQTAIRDASGSNCSQVLPIHSPDPPAVEVRHVRRTCPLLKTRLQRLDSRKSIRERLPRIKIPQNPVVIAQKDCGLSQTIVSEAARSPARVVQHPARPLFSSEH